MLRLIVKGVRLNIVGFHKISVKNLLPVCSCSAICLQTRTLIKFSKSWIWHCSSKGFSLSQIFFDKFYLQRAWLTLNGWLKIFLFHLAPFRFDGIVLPNYLWVCIQILQLKLLLKLFLIFLERGTCIVSAPFNFIKVNCFYDLRQSALESSLNLFV